LATDFDLSKQVGPLPLGAWIAVVAGGLGIAWYMNRNQKEPTTTLADSDVGTGGGQQLTYDAPTTIATESKVIETNDEWARAAFNWLRSEGKDPIASDSMVRKVLAGETLTQQETGLYALVIVAIGPPPIPLPPIPAPVLPTPPAPAAPGTPTLSVVMPTTVKRGGGVGIRMATRVDGKARGYQFVVIDSHTTNQKPYWKRAAPIIMTNKSGTAYYVVRPRKNTTYRLTFKYGAKQAVVSKTVRVT
jgi:hypothetical protein